MPNPFPSIRRCLRDLELPSNSVSRRRIKLTIVRWLPKYTIFKIWYNGVRNFCEKFGDMGRKLKGRKFKDPITLEIPKVTKFEVKFMW